MIDKTEKYLLLAQGFFFVISDYLNKHPFTKKIMFIFLLFIFNEASTDAFITTEALAETPSSDDLEDEMSNMTGVRCPNCARHGRNTLVIPGKNCHVCGHPC